MEDEVEIDCVPGSATELLEESAPDEVELELGAKTPDDDDDEVLLTVEVLGSKVVDDPLVIDTGVVDGGRGPEERDVDPMPTDEDEDADPGTPALEVV